MKLLAAKVLAVPAAIAPVVKVEKLMVIFGDANVAPADTASAATPGAVTPGPTPGPAFAPKPVADSDVPPPLTQPAAVAPLFSAGSKVSRATTKVSETLVRVAATLPVLAIVMAYCTSAPGMFFGLDAIGPLNGSQIGVAVLVTVKVAVAMI